jgi:hypothetical protein
MATQVAIAQTRDYAVMSLKESGAEIAALLGIESPDLGFFYRDSDYQQAEELKAIAAFMARVQTALQADTPPPIKKKVSNGKS